MTAGEPFNFCRDVFDPHARDPGRLAMLWVDDAGAERRLSFAHFAQRSRALAAGLQRLGVRRGETVIVVLPRLPEWWEAMLAGLRAGLVISPGTTQLTARDLAHRLPAAEAAAVIADPASAARVDEALAQTGHRLRARVLVGDGAPGTGTGSRATREGWTPYEDALAEPPAGWTCADTGADDPALLYFTSGTTGFAKMALHTQASYGRGHRITAQWLGLQPSDLHWNLSDTGWAKAAWSSFFAPWITGCAIFVHHAPRFHPRRTLELLAAHPITTLCGAPTNYRMLIQEDLAGCRFPALRSCAAAGEPINREVLAVWQRATGQLIRDGYGQTETVLLVGNFPGAELRPGSMGRPAPGLRVLVAAEDGREQPAGAEGEIALAVGTPRPPGLFAGYWKDAARTASVLRAGLYFTGDRAVRDADGFFWFVGRADDVIKSAGYRIGPFEVESALLEHPAVAESAVVGVPDPLRGQIVKAYVVLSPQAAVAGHRAGPALVSELQRFVQERTAPYKYPREIEFVAELPKTVSGKIRRVELRER